MSLKIISIPAKSGRPTGSIVMLHGWGANAQDVAALSTYLDLPDHQFFFPDAPFPHPQAPGGKMWYGLPSDYSFFSSPTFREQPELKESRSLLLDWMRSLESSTGVPLSHTILGGFSQGGAMTLDLGLDLSLAGLMVLSGYLHAPIESSRLAKIPPVLLVHGQQDPVVPVTAAQIVRQSLLSLGASVQYFELNMGHEIQPIVLSRMQSFIEEMVAASE